MLEIIVIDTKALSFLLSSEFDVNVTRISSKVPSRQINLVPILPMLKFDRFLTE